MTAQLHEQLMVEGHKLLMISQPTIPDHERILKVRQEDFKEQAALIIFSTCCYRNYMGYWEIKDGKLYLNSIVGRYKLDGDEPLFADWYSGELRVRTGEVLKYINHGYASIYEGELSIEIVEGKMISIKELKRDDFDLKEEIKPAYQQSLINRFFNVVFQPIVYLGRLLLSLGKKDNDMLE